MDKKSKNAGLSLVTLTILLFVAGAAYAQEDTTPKKRITAPATVSGLIGGEAHDSYVIKVQKGRTMTVEITWTKEDGNRAEFKVSRSASFYGGDQQRFGLTTYLEDKWFGKIPKTGDYYIYVVGYPTASYKLKITVK